MIHRVSITGVFCDKATKDESPASLQFLSGSPLAMLLYLSKCMQIFDCLKRFTVIQPLELMLFLSAVDKADHPSLECRHSLQRFDTRPRFKGRRPLPTGRPRIFLRDYFIWKKCGDSKETVREKFSLSLS